VDDVALGGDTACLGRMGTAGIELVVWLDAREGAASESTVDGVRVEEPRRERCRKETFDLR
jgi:hypothetical protein